LAEAGARLWCLGRTAADLRALAAEVGGEALIADLTDDAATWDALDGMMDTIGGAPDVVVNSAGVFAIASAAEETVAAFDAAVAVNLRAPFLVNRAVLPSMLQRGSGLIVNIGSVAGRKALRGNTAYSASKFGLRGYHAVLLEELRGTGVRATLLEPSATDTPLWDPLDPDSNPELPSRSAMLAAEDVAAAVMFLATRPETVRIPLLQIERA
jgi:NADP-dependent 3-hydroxy acid dehydrogenase YdfG